MGCIVCSPPLLNIKCGVIMYSVVHVYRKQHALWMSCFYFYDVYFGKSWIHTVMLCFFYMVEHQYLLDAVIKINNLCFLLPILALGIKRIGHLNFRTIRLSGISGYGTGSMVSEWDKNIKLPWVFIVTSWHASWYGLRCCQDTECQDVTSFSLRLVVCQWRWWQQLIGNLLMTDEANLYSECVVAR